MPKNNAGGNKRKGEAPASTQQSKKPRDEQTASKPASAAAAPKQPAAKQQQQGKQQGKKGKKPEPEPEEEEEEDSDSDDIHPTGPVDEAALAAIEALAPDAEKINAELEALETQMQAEIYAIQRRYNLKKRPILRRRSELLESRVPGLWKALLSGHEVFAAQMDDSDHSILDHLRSVDVEEQYAPEKDGVKQQITGLSVTMGFAAGSSLVKAGRYTKRFVFNDETETLTCVAVPAAQQPFVSASFVKEHPDSFFATWFASEGEDDGVLAAQDALASELLVDPLQLYTHVSMGHSLSELQGGSDDDDDDDDDDEDGIMAFAADDDDDEDEEAPELVD